MAYKSLYRVYRPKTFEEVAGQNHIVKTLKNALKNDKIAHAYLFCGPRGTGKTSMAKLFAKALNCEEGFGHICNECSNCRAVNDGSHPDVIEIDAASNNGVEEVRDLIEKVRYSPIKGKYKVYIIDEVHMMTSGAFNALLKTLEEPPSHVVFILATTEPHKVIPTIVSRCQRYDFTKVSDEDINLRIENILKEEQIAYDDGAVKLIISLADGGVRDALSMLDQVLAYSDNTLNLENVLDLFALTSKEEKINLINAIAKKDTYYILDKLNQFFEGGIDIKRLTSDILDILKDVLIFNLSLDENLLKILNKSEAQNISDLLNDNEIMEMIQILLKVQNDFKLSTNIKSLFEITLLNLSMIKGNNKIEKNDDIGKKKETKSETIEAKPSNVKKDEETVSLFSEEDFKIPASSKFKENDSYNLSDEQVINIMIKGNKAKKKELISKWGEIAKLQLNDTIGKYAAMIKDARPYITTKNVLILEFDFEKLRNKAILKNNQAGILALVKSLDKDIEFVYGLSRTETIRLLRSYMNLSQLNRLPIEKDVIIDLEELKK